MKILGIEIRLPKTSKRERRGAERVGTFEALYLDYKGSKHSVSGSGEGKDLSISGIRFASSRSFSKGDRLSLQLRFTPGSVRPEVLEVQARVVRCYRPTRSGRYRVGCNFENLSEAALKTLQDVMLWLKQREKKYLFFRWK
jgi:hypothetical protein